MSPHKSLYPCSTVLQPSRRPTGYEPSRVCLGLGRVEARIANQALSVKGIGVKARVLCQTILSPNDTLAVNGSMELECTILQHFHPGVRLDAWTILAAMQISDRPAFVRHDKNIPLDEIIAIEPVKRIRPFKRPLAAWAKKISKYRRQAKETFGDVIPLVFFCPINHTDSHYTLL
ncbi:hypothetical protein BDV37DRAFT_237773 [Aspergillus pseudonomiae]|uniref:Uncharacterized protein n=1 Tax=Aspergillus pseudonomiae TaxID=1506151 RepID=A0A5N7DR91_9EURO|nr:uncharacterized protein BDV37DRAFT_237773 [Aspergillus pseudonomiae]KAE8408980.1 hypothetical protein BDV37DRAFT_237773 [Aspergillus pseudonomiae]